MLYDKERRKILIECDEFIKIAMLGSSSYARDEDTPKIDLIGGIPHEFEFSSEGIDFILKLKKPQVSSKTLTFVYGIQENPKRLKNATQRQARGEAFACAYAAAVKDETEEFLIKIIYQGCGTETVREEQPNFSSLEIFFNKCATSLIHRAKAEIERVTVRLPSMKTAKFPYREIREGQNEFIRSAYRTIARGGELFASAPTGTGKTVSAIFPAIRALGDGRIEKAFYLTPKTTVAAGVKECLQRFAEEGVKIRAAILSAKERCCPLGLICREGKDKCQNLNLSKLSLALTALAEEGLTSADAEDFLRIGKKYSVCPHELSLAYSEMCDIIVCDFNYLFDPGVYIRRFFDKGGNYAFLIDEAHNLGERAREMYSAELDTGLLYSIENSGLFSDYSKAKTAAKELSKKFFKSLYPLVHGEVREAGEQKRGAYKTAALPDFLYGMFEQTIDICKNELYKTSKAEDEEAPLRSQVLREYILALEKFEGAILRFDTGFELFVFYDGKNTLREGETIKEENLKAKIYCLDTGRVLRQRLNKGRSSVFFSGTLSPQDFYRDTLGGDRSSEILKVSSPFVSEQVAVNIVDSVSTRFNEREATLIDICKFISAAIAAKKGHYMIFTPSYSYTEALYKTFASKFPNVRALLQRPNMSREEKNKFIETLSRATDKYLAAFCVTGGIFAEGIDLAGEKLIGAIIVGISMPTPTYEREAICEYYNEKTENGKLYAYIYPGMNKVFQAAGRVIRSEDDRGIIVLIDDRFADPIYREAAPALFGDMRFFDNARKLNEHIKDFWEN